MSLRFALLGFLCYRPRSGYDLKKHFDSTVGHVWSAQHSQIYTTLARLAEDGLVTVEVVPQESRPDRKIYEVTHQGRDELRRWLVEAEPTLLGKSAFLLQTYFLGLLSDDEAMQLLKERAACIRESIAALEALRAEDSGGSKSRSARRRDFFSWLTLDYGLRLLDMSASWVEDVIARIRTDKHELGKPAALTFPGPGRETSP